MKFLRVARYEVFMGESGRWYWRLTGGNNECQSRSSQGWDSWWEAKRSAWQARRNSRFALIRIIGR